MASSAGGDPLLQQVWLPEIPQVEVHSPEEQVSEYVRDAQVSLPMLIDFHERPDRDEELLFNGTCSTSGLDMSTTFKHPLR